MAYDQPDEQPRAVSTRPWAVRVRVLGK